MRLRKEMKREAKKVLKKHYWIFVMLCLLAAVLGTEFTSSLSLTKSGAGKASDAGSVNNRKGTLEVDEKFSEIVYHLVLGDEQTGLQIADEADREERESTEADPKACLLYTSV